uniref:hypothetical protein n=1 Tax=Flavobacterium sp. TaxID=239 RepID=UPI00404B20C8
MKSIKYLPLLFCLLLNSCKVYEFKYGSKDPKLKEFLPNSDMAYLVFRKGFERDSIKVFQDKNMIFNDTITNNKLNQKTIEINPTKITKIQFEGIEKLLLIKPEFLKGYKIKCISVIIHNFVYLFDN